VQSDPLTENGDLFFAESPDHYQRYSVEFVKAVDEECEWDPVETSKGKPPTQPVATPWDGIFYAGGSVPSDVDIEVARYREREGGDPGSDDKLLSMHHAMRLLLAGGEAAAGGSTWRRRL